MSTWYYGASLPSGREPSNAQLDKMKDDWEEDGVTKSGTVGVVGMFGHSFGGGDSEVWGESYDEYYFYMKFTPYDVEWATTVDAKFRMWF